MQESHSTDQQSLVQWSFLQYKKTAPNAKSPVPCFLHSCTQIGGKLLIYGGCDHYGEAQTQLFLYDTSNFHWANPVQPTDLQEHHPGGRYGHSATLIEMHPPKLIVYGGMINGGTFEFDEPDTVGAVTSEDDAGDNPNSKISAFAGIERSFMASRRKGKKNNSSEETDDAIYFLTLLSHNWIWSKPVVLGNLQSKPKARAEHSCCKIGANEVAIFGGWAGRPMNDLWSFNFVDMEWRVLVSSGIQPRPRYRHTAEFIGSNMYILGGSDNNDDIPEQSRNLTIHVLSLTTMQWTHPTISGGFNPFPRSGHGSAVIGTVTIAIFGGKLNNQVFFNDLILLDIETMVGSRVNALESHLPAPVSNSSLSIVGNKCFVFGGTDVKGNCFNDIRSVDISYYLSKNDITVGEGASSDYTFKILIIGDAYNTFHSKSDPTVGIDFNSRMIRVDRAICKLEIWDTAGQERFSTITANYYRGAQGALVVYDVGKRESFEHVQGWFDRVRQLGGENIVTVLVGNKNDIDLSERQVSSADGEEAAKKMSTSTAGGGGDAMAMEDVPGDLMVPYVETSALNGSNVENAFVTMAQQIKRSIDRRGLSGVQLNSSGVQKTGGVRISNSENLNSLTSKCGCGM